MPKSRVSAEQEMRHLSVKLPQAESKFIQEAVREVIAHLRTWFRLPTHVVDALKRDAEAHGLEMLCYLQMLLLKRYEYLGARHLAAITSVPEHGKHR